MWLVLRLIVRLVGVVALCLAFAVAWAMVDTHRSIDRETSASADRVAAQLEILYWRELMWRGGLRKERLLPTPEWQTLATLKLVSPGVCVAFAPGAGEPTRLCGQVEGVGEQAPVWFKSIYEGISALRRASIAPSARAKLTLGRSSPLPTLKPQCVRPGCAFPRSPISRRRWRWPSLCLRRWPSLTRSRRPPRLSEACAGWRLAITVGVCRRFARASLP